MYFHRVFHIICLKCRGFTSFEYFTLHKIFMSTQGKIVSFYFVFLFTAVHIGLFFKTHVFLCMALKSINHN